MKRLLLSFALLALVGAADPGRSVLGPDGKLDAARVAAFVAWVEPSIREYPPRFKDKKHQETVVEATQLVVKELSSADLATVKDQQLLTNTAFTFAMAHNIDLGTAAKAEKTYEQALALNPEDRRTNYLFGMFLVSTRARHFDALPRLEKAYALGERDALFTLGLLWVEKGEKDKGLEMLEIYAKEHPDSEQHTRRMIQGIKDGKLKFKHDG